VAALILSSTPGPGFALDAQQQRYLGAPRLLAPLFAANARRRLQPEIERAIPDRAGRWAFARGQLVRMAKAPMSPRLMARRMKAAAGHDFVEDCRGVRAATLVVTGEPGLDRVVPIESSHEYLARIPGARSVGLRDTGHLGIVTRPGSWADAIGEFMQSIEPEHQVVGDRRAVPPTTRRGLS
jgi:pimeloyl-ACP methyl ester carboxylesterase